MYRIQLACVGPTVEHVVACSRFAKARDVVITFRERQYLIFPRRVLAEQANVAHLRATQQNTLRIVDRGDRL